MHKTKFLRLLWVMIFFWQASSAQWTQTLPGLPNKVTASVNGFTIQGPVLWATTETGILNLTNPGNPAYGLPPAPYQEVKNNVSVLPVPVALLQPQGSDPGAGYILQCTRATTVSGISFPSQLVKTTFPYDGYGGSWMDFSPTPAPGAGTNYIGFATTQQGYTYLATSGGRNGVYRSSLLRANFTDFNIGPFMAPKLAVTGTPALPPTRDVNVITAYGNDVYAGTESGVIKLSNDIGSWAQLGLTGMRITCLAVNGTDLFAATDGHGIYHAASTNNGGSWSTLTYVSYGLPDNYKVNALLLDNGTLYAGVTGSGVLFTSVKSSNGTDWNEFLIAMAGMGTLLNPGSVTTVNALIKQNGHVYAGTNSGVWVLQ